MSTADPLAELRAHWDTFAPLFAERMEPTTLLLARTLIDQLELPEAQALLEVGAGAGGAATVAREALRAQARQVVTDLSPAMVALARERLPAPVEVLEADAQRLPFEEATFDRYLANLSLMLVPDPDRALAEAARVLRPGALAGWSVWGRPERSPMFTLPPRAAAEVGIELPEVPRSNFHLGDREALAARVSGHGFERVVAWYQPMVREVHDPARFAAGVAETPRWRELLDGERPERVAAFRAALVRLAGDVLEGGAPIALEALLIVARRSASR